MNEDKVQMDDKGEMDTQESCVPHSENISNMSNPQCVLEVQNIQGIGSIVISNSSKTAVLHDYSRDNNLDVALTVDVDNSSNSSTGGLCSTLFESLAVKDFVTVCQKGVVGDGNDSGVEFGGSGSYGSGSSPALQRAFSNTSGGYASSFGGLDDSVTASTTPVLSCDSSLISCYSTCGDSEDLANSTTVLLLAGGGGDGTSEGGSESSSIAGRDVARSSRSASVKRAVANISVKKKLESKSVPDSSRVKCVSSASNTCSRPRSASSRQQMCATSKTSSTGWTMPTRLSLSGCRRDRTVPLSVGEKVNSPTKQTQNTIGPRPSSIMVGNPSSKVRSRSGGENSGHVNNRKDITNTKTKNGTKLNPLIKARPGANDDGRWPSTNRNHSSRRVNAIDILSKKMTSSLTSSLLSGSSMESKASALEKYATLPRRRRHKSPEVRAVDTPHRSHSVSRDPSLNRAASLRKQHHQKESGILGLKSLPPYPQRRAALRTRIFHEICIQTALTGRDVANALAGVGVKEYSSLTSIEKSEKEIQVNKQFEELENLEARLKQLAFRHSQLQMNCDQQKLQLDNVSQLLSHEKAEKQVLQEQLHHTNKRVLAMLGNVQNEMGGSTDSLQELEVHLQSSGRVVIKQQHEINDLQSLCHTLQRDLEKSLAAQKTLLQQQQEIEAESIELQDFLQAEKSTLADALKDAESEVHRTHIFKMKPEVHATFIERNVKISGHKELLVQRELELQRQQEECKHLVRISEQRRQENLALQARLCGLEKRSKELLLQQGAAVSGAAVALSGLSSRLDGLVEQLVTAYNISEKDLEDVIFHNEAYSKSNSSVEASPEKTPVKQVPECSIHSSHMPSSPKRGASFVTAVIAAIRNAAGQSPFSNGTRLVNETTASSTPSPQEMSADVSLESGDLLESEKDPCVMTDDETVNDSRNDSNDSEGHVANIKSLQSLSQAILVRQQSEMAQCVPKINGSDKPMTASFDGCEDLTSSLNDYCPAATLVDQIIDVDNLVTRLLKILRIIQLENETCIEELQDERVHLAEQFRQEQEKRSDVQGHLNRWERLGARLRNELEEARLQLQLKVQELEETKADLQSHKEQVEHLSQDVCNLSSLCQHAEFQLQIREAEAENALRQWQQNGQIPSPDVLDRIVTARNEIPLLKEQLAEKELQLVEINQKSSISKQLLTDNWHRAITEVRRQYDAIDRALETLQSIQSIVTQCPPLAKLQQELEESNFHCITSLPVVEADLNANAAVVSSCETRSNGSNDLSSNSRINGCI